MADDESLFSLEVAAESLTNVAVPCVLPAIAFRLLDFPTQIIQKQENSQNKNSGSSIVDNNGTYLIQSGKSCLFKMNKDVLLANLERTPLYVMLVDMSGSKTKLLASMTLSLTSCFSNVLKSIDNNGLDVPTAHGNRGIFEMYNLMGTSVAIVKLNYSIFSLGGTINGHVKTTDSIAKSHCTPSNGQIQNTRRENLQRIKRIAENENGDLVQDVVVEKKAEVPSPIKRLLDTETQTEKFYNGEPHVKDVYKKSKQEKTRKENNITRPPPLYYNSKSTSIALPQSRRIARQHFFDDGITRLSEETIVNATICPRKNHQTVSVQTVEQIETQDPAKVSKHDNEGRQLVDLPLINALLRELSLAKQSIVDKIQTLEQPDTSAAPKMYDISIQTKVSPPVKTAQKIKKTAPYSNKGNGQKHNTLRPNTKGVLIQRPPVKLNKVALKRHTTKTQKLREALNKKKRSENAPIKIGTRESSLKNLKGKTKVNVKVDKPKEMQEFACQVETYGHDGLQRESLGKRDEENQEIEYNETGVQVAASYDTSDVHVAVQQSDLLQFNKEDLPLSAVGHTPRDIMGSRSTSSRHSAKGHDFPDDELSQTNTNVLNVKIPGHYQEHVTPGSNSEWSSHSRKSTSSLPAAAKPVFSTYSPIPVTKNSRYTKKDLETIKPEEALSFDSGLLNDLVDKPVIHLSKSSSVQHNYSDSFDSFESGHTTKSDSNKEI